MALAAMVSACAIDAPGGADTSAGIAAEPAGTCEHEPCEAGGPLDPACDDCVLTVCDEDAFCCEVEWDDLCVENAEILCGLDCGIEECEHDVCVTGTPLSETCDPCVTQVCDANAACCSTGWDDSCVAAAEALCGVDCGVAPVCGDGTCDAAAGEDCTTCEVDCGPCGGECEHDLCDAGTPLDPSCDTCVADVCELDSFCCEVEWDDVCVGLAVDTCGIDCGVEPGCGDGVCDPSLGEDCNTCSADCGPCGGECEHGFCDIGPPLDPTCDTCAADVCAADDFCCTVEWDDVCVGLAVDLCGVDCGVEPGCGDGVCDPSVGEDCNTCSADCGPCGGECEHDFCDAGAPLDPACDTCAADVCAIDDFCCTVEWDDVCVGLAEDTCGLDCGGAGECEHDLCEAGSPLEPTCDACVAGVCAQDSFCCDEAWDASCVAAAEALCGLECGGGECEHDLCEAGTPLDPTCDECVNEVCAIDSFCCEVEWDDLCVGLAEDTCGLDCGGGGDECEHGLCETGAPLDPTCDDCAQTVCDADSFCCEVAWDGICVGLAESLCGIECTAPPECGDGVCEGDENCVTCASDCGECAECPHDVCESGAAMPFGCNTCVPIICKIDSFCCDVSWDSLCVGLVPEHCGRSCE
ncbi:hypothetical protein [Haliangium ochraceum]|nr:hypothetical protein [Haliangium ochraceum]